VWTKSLTRDLVLIQGCRFGEAALSRGDLTEVEWRILRVLLPRERKPGKRGRGRPPEDNRSIERCKAGIGASSNSVYL
jgi:hypothetical protein